MTIRLPEPERDRRYIKQQDKRNKALRLYLLRQCAPGEAYGTEPGDEKTARLFHVMSSEGYFLEVAPGQYTITEKGQDYRKRLQRPTWRQWLLDNARWVITTIVAVASVIVAIYAAILCAN